MSHRICAHTRVICRRRHVGDGVLQLVCQGEDGKDAAVEICFSACASATREALLLKGSSTLPASRCCSSALSTFS